MLLSQSQATLALSAGLILLCSLALFISGIVLQQRTVSELRTLLPHNAGQVRALPLGYHSDQGWLIKQELAAAAAHEQTLSGAARFERLDNGIDPAELGAEEVQRRRQGWTGQGEEEGGIVS